MKEKIPLANHTKLRCPMCKKLGDLSSSEDYFLQNFKVKGDQFRADLTCMNCKKFSIPWEGTFDHEKEYEMVRIPGTTFSDYTPKTDWKKAFDEQRKEIEILRKSLYAACERLNDGSAWADESEELLEMCKLARHSHPCLAAGESDE